MPEHYEEFMSAGEGEANPNLPPQFNDPNAAMKKRFLMQAMLAQLQEAGQSFGNVNSEVPAGLPQGTQAPVGVGQVAEPQQFQQGESADSLANNTRLRMAMDRMMSQTSQPDSRFIAPGGSLSGHTSDRDLSFLRGGAPGGSLSGHTSDRDLSFLGDPEYGGALPGQIGARDLRFILEQMRRR
jgi:hypothetical protein